MGTYEGNTRIFIAAIMISVELFFARLQIKWDKIQTALFEDRQAGNKTLKYITYPLSYSGIISFRHVFIFPL